MEENALKRALIAILLCILIMVFYPKFLARYHPARQEEAPVVRAPVVEEALIPLAPEVKQKLDEKLESFETSKYRLTFSNIGGCVKEVLLKDYPDPVTGEPYELVKVVDPGEAILAIKEMHPFSIPDTATYDAQRLDNGIIYTYEAPGEMAVSKRFLIDDNKHSVALELKLKNLAPYAKEFKYRLIGGAHIDEGTGPRAAWYLEINTSLNGKAIKEGKGRPARSGVLNPGSVDWVALKSKYYSIILKPFQATSGSFYNILKNKELLTGIEMAPITLRPGEATTYKFLLYAGPNNYEKVRSYNLGLEDVIYRGFFGGVSKLLLSVLKFYHKVVRNWGLSIILLTITVSICLYPLTRKSLKSMKKMQELQPHIVKLRQELKDNPQKLQKETMELYKKHRVNPLGGCLPMLLQMPIFIALYQLLVRSIELKGAKFLWIKDLSSPDALFRLPKALPVIGNHPFNLLPILAIVVMFLQQKFSAVGGAKDPHQKMMGMMMPIVFGFIFYSFPAGFVLYFLTTTTMTMLYQYKALK